MALLKRYLLCCVMMSFVGIAAMEKEDTYQYLLQELCDKIDQSYLGIANDVWLKQFRGTFWSACNSYCLSDQGVECGIITINSYVSWACHQKDYNKSKLIKMLVAKHFYVHYLMKRYITQKMAEIEKVTGFTLDRIYNLIGKSDDYNMEKLAYRRAGKLFFKNAGINEYIVSGDRKDTIHATLLSGLNNIQKESLSISSDDTLVGAKDENEKLFFWNTQEGELVYTDEFKKASWNNQCRSVDEKGYVSYSTVGKDYYAEALGSESSVMNDSRYTKVVTTKDTPSIILFKRPTEASYLCQKAYYNSIAGNKETRKTELPALLKAEALNKIEGFPTKNLKTKIMNEIKNLQYELEL